MKRVPALAPLSLAALAVAVVLGAAGCGGGGGSAPGTVSSVRIDPVPPPTTAPPPQELVDAGEQNFDSGLFGTEIGEPQQPTVDSPTVDANPTAPDFFAGFLGGGEIPGAARGATVNDSPYPSAGGDAFPDSATLGLFGITYVSPTEIRGNVQFADSGSHLAPVPVSFSETGLSYPNKLVYEAGGSLSLESRVITYYRSGYRNDPFHERSWFAVISGEAAVNGVDGFTFAIFAEDRSNPDDPNDTRTGKDFFAITIYSPTTPYGGSFERDGLLVWGLQDVVYHNQYPLRAGDIRALDPPPEPTG